MTRSRLIHQLHPGWCGPSVICLFDTMFPVSPWPTQHPSSATNGQREDGRPPTFPSLALGCTAGSCYPQFQPYTLLWDDVYASWSLIPVQCGRDEELSRRRRACKVPIGSLAFCTNAKYTTAKWKVSNVPCILDTGSARAAKQFSVMSVWLLQLFERHSKNDARAFWMSPSGYHIWWLWWLNIWCHYPIFIPKSSRSAWPPSRPSESLISLSCASEMTLIRVVQHIQDSKIAHCMKDDVKVLYRTHQKHMWLLWLSHQRSHQKR